MRTKVLWLLGSNGIYAVCQWAVLIALARLTTKADVGGFSLAMAVVTPVVLFSACGLRAVISTDQGGRVSFSEAFWLRVFALLGLLPSFVGLSNVLPILKPWCPLIAAVSIAKAADSVSDLIYGLLQQKHLVPPVGISRILQGLCQLIAFVGALKSGLGVVGASFCYAIASLATTLLYDFPWLRRMLGDQGRYTGSKFLPPIPPRQSLLELAKSVAPLALIGVLPQLNVAYVRIFLESEVGSAELGVFAAFSYIVAVGAIAQAAALSAFGPTLGEYFLNERDKYVHLSRKIILLTIVVSAAFAMLITVLRVPIINALYGPSYLVNLDTFTIILFGFTAAAIHASAYQVTLAIHNFKRSSISYFVQTFCILLGAPVAIRYWGGAGAASIALITSAIASVIHVVVFKEIFFSTSLSGKIRSTSS